MCCKLCCRAIETGAVLLLENLDEDMDDMIEQVWREGLLCG